MNQLQTQQNSNNLQQFFEQDFVKEQMQKLVGDNTSSFVTSALQVAQSNYMLRNVKPESIFNACLMSASLGLAISNVTGYAYIVPYKSEAQFQIGYKGLIQLAIATGQYRSIKVVTVYENDTNQDVLDRMSSLIPSDDEETKKVIGYTARFVLNNGFEDSLSMSVKQLHDHAKRYSKTYNSSKMNVWRDNFKQMAKKTVLKLLLSQKAPLLVGSNLQKAMEVDQAVIRDVEKVEKDYVDNPDYVEKDDFNKKERLTDDRVSKAILAIEEDKFSLDSLLDKFEFTKQQQLLIEESFDLSDDQRSNFTII